MVEERRKRSRVSVSRPVVIHLSSGKKVHAYITDMAENGMAVLTTMPADIGAKLVFVFSLPIGNDVHEFKITGEIMYSRVRADKYTNGIAFLNLNTDNQNIIKNFIQTIRSKRG